MSLPQRSEGTNIRLLKLSSKNLRDVRKKMRIASSEITLRATPAVGAPQGELPAGLGGAGGGFSSGFGIFPSRPDPRSSEGGASQRFLHLPRLLGHLRGHRGEHRVRVRLTAGGELRGEHHGPVHLQPARRPRPPRGRCPSAAARTLDVVPGGGEGVEQHVRPARPPRRARRPPRSSWTAAAWRLRDGR